MDVARLDVKDAILLWQVVAGIAEGRLVRERPHEKPNAVVEVLQLLPDGTEIKVVWSWLAYDDRASWSLFTIRTREHEG